MVSLFLLAGFVASALFAVLIIPNILLISYKRRLFDIPDSRKVHKVPVPRLGGLSFLPVILISFCLVTAFYYYYIGTPLNGFSAEKVLCDFLSLTRFPFSDSWKHVALPRGSAGRPNRGWLSL